MLYDFYLRQIVHGITKPLHIDLHKAPITLGGNKYSELKQYSKVSHPHATVESKDGQWYVQDLNSFYGTFVNGFHIGTNRHPLQIGDQIALGSVEDGFICALSVTPLKIKEEPIELVDISDDSPSIKSEPKDDYEISDLPPIKTTCIVPKPESEISPCNKFKFDLKKSIKTEPPDDCSHSSLSIFTNAKNISNEKNCVENFAKTNHGLVKIIPELVERQEKQNLQNSSHFPAVLHLHDDSTNTINLYSLCSKDSFNAINHKKLTKHIECMNSTEYSLKSPPYNHQKLSLAKEVSSSRNCIDLHLSSEGHQRIDLDAKYYNKSLNSFAKEYKVSGRKRPHVNSVQDEEWSLCEAISSNSENLRIGVNATEISELGVSEAEDWFKTAKRKRLYLDPKKDTFKKSLENFLPKCYNSAVYSSDLSTLVKDNSCISSSIEDSFETNAMDIVEYSQNKMVLTNSNPEINNNRENMLSRNIDNFCQVIGDNQVSNMAILNSNEGMCPDFLLQISSIPEENKICTNFLAPLVSANQQKFIAKSQDDGGFVANELEDHLTLSFNKENATVDSIESAHLLQQNTLLTESQQIGFKDRTYDFLVENSQEKDWSLVPKVFDESSPVQVTENSDLTLTDIGNSKTSNNLTLISPALTKNSFHVKMVPITNPSTNIASSIKKSVLRDIISTAGPSSTNAAFGNFTVSRSRSQTGKEVSLNYSNALLFPKSDYKSLKKEFPFNHDSSSVSNDGNDGLQMRESAACVASISVKSESGAASVSSVSNESPLHTSVLQAIVSSSKQITPSFNTSFSTSSNKSTFSPLTEAFLVINSDLSLSANLSSSLDLSGTSNVSKDCKWVPVPSNEKDVFNVNRLQVSEDNFGIVSTSVPKTMSQTTTISPTSQVSLISTSMLKSIISLINHNSSMLLPVHNALSNSEVLCNQNTVMPIINSNLTIDSDLPLQETSGKKSLETKTSASVEPSGTLDVLQDSKWLNKWIPVSPTNKKNSSDSLIENEGMSGATSTSVLKCEPATVTTVINQPLFSDPSLLKKDRGLFQGENIFNSDECTSVVSEDSKTLNIGIPVSLNEKTSPAMSYVASTAILKSEATAVSTTTNPLLQSGPPVFGINDGISQGQNIPTPDEYTSQDKKWINNWVPVPPIEEHTSCINRLSMMEHNLHMASTPVLKFVSEEPVVSTSEGFSLISDLQLQLKKENELQETNASTYIELPAVISGMHDSKWLNNSSPVSSAEERISSIHNLSLKDYNSNNNSSLFCEFVSEASPDTPLFVPSQRRSKHVTCQRRSKHVTKTKENAFLVNKVPTNNYSSEISYVTVSESVLQTTPMLSMSKQISMDNCNTSPSHTYADCMVRIPSPTINIVTPITLKSNKLPDVQNLVSSNQQSSSQNMNVCSKQTRLTIIKNLVEFDVKCLKELKYEVQPPFVKLNSVGFLPLHFSSFDHYASSFVPLLMLEVWKNVHMESKPIWEDNIFNLFYFSVLSFESNSYMDEFHCEALVNELFFLPIKGSAVIMKIKAQNNTYYNGCCYIYKHSIEKLERDSLNSRWEKIGDENLRNSKLWKFSVFVKPQMIPPVLNQLMRGNGICSVQKYLRLADGMEYLKSSPLCKNILEPKPNVFCEPSKRTLKLIYSDALAAINTEILESPSEPKIVLLQGAPGTGKTQVIVNMIKKLIAEDSQSKILVTAPTDATLDVIGHRLIASKHGNFFIRLGQTDNVDKHMIPFCLNTKADIKYKKNFKNQMKLFSFLRKSQSKTWHAKKKLFLAQCNSEDWVNSSKLKCKIEVFQNARIVLSTLGDCSYLKSLSFTAHGSSSIFSCCIMDDVTRCPELEVLQSLIVRANKLLLIGDLQQVPPEGFSSLAVSYGFNRSMFARFSNYLSRQQRKELVLELKEQFRMHSEIWHFPSNKFYSNRSLIMHYPNSQSAEVFQQPYYVYDILGKESNVIYDQVIFRICLRLRTIKKTAASIGIIIPSKSLRSYYMEHILKNDAAYNHIEIDTIDAFRGREKDFIILSCDKSKFSDNSSFLYCRRAMTVALTRARKCLIICMSSDTIRHSADWQHLIADAKARTHYKMLSCVKAIHSAIQKIIVINKESVISSVTDRPVMQGGPELHRNEE